jgi:hypothetical protein
VVTAPLYWKTLKTIQMSAWEYLGAVRPGLDGAVAMAIVVGLLKFELPTRTPLPLRLAVEIATGAGTYIGTVLLLHRERVLSFLQIVKRMRSSARPPVASASSV